MAAGSLYSESCEKSIREVLICDMVSVFNGSLRFKNPGAQVEVKYKE